MEDQETDPYKLNINTRKHNNLVTFITNIELIFMKKKKEEELNFVYYKDLQGYLECIISYRETYLNIP